MSSPKTLIVTVVEIHGQCPLYRLGDHFLIREGYRLETSRPLCMHALASLMPYYAALSRGLSPHDLSLADEDGFACVQCLDPAHRTGGGTVVFQIRPEEAQHGASG